MSDETSTPEAESESSQAEQQANADAILEENNQPEQAQLEKFNDDQVAPPDEDNLNAILDIPISLSVEIGQTKISIRNLLQLNQGSVVELDRLAGEPLDVMVNNTLVAHGEIVVINEKYGIRLTDVINALERVKNLH